MNQNDEVGWTPRRAGGTSRSHLLNCCWNHPVDLHYFLGWNSSDTTENNYNCGANIMLQGWPRMVLQVWELDCYNRILPVGYGFLHLPATSGTYDLTVPCWRPKGTYMEEIKAFFLGPTPQLADDTWIFGRAWEDRCKLVTIPCLQKELESTTSKNNSHGNYRCLKIYFYCTYNMYFLSLWNYYLDRQDRN